MAVPGDGLDMAVPPWAGQPARGGRGHVSDVSSGGVPAGQQVSVRDEPAADARARGDEQGVPSAAGGSGGRLAEGMRVHIVDDADREPGARGEFGDQVGSGPAGQRICRRDDCARRRVYDPGRADADPPRGLTATRTRRLRDDGGGHLGDGVKNRLGTICRGRRHAAHVRKFAVDDGAGTDLRASDIDGDSGRQGHSSPAAATISRTRSASSALSASIGSAIRFEPMTPMSCSAVLNPPSPAAPADTRPGVAAPVMSNRRARSCSAAAAQSPAFAAS